jgi:ABC-type glycerol-3-phosphate transport system permease component
MRHAKEEPLLLKIILDALLVVLFLAILFPFVWIVLGSFKTETDILASAYPGSLQEHSLGGDI